MSWHARGARFAPAPEGSSSCSRRTAAQCARTSEMARVGRRADSRAAAEASGAIARTPCARRRRFRRGGGGGGGRMRAAAAPNTAPPASAAFAAAADAPVGAKRVMSTSHACCVRSGSWRSRRRVTAFAVAPAEGSAISPTIVFRAPRRCNASVAAACASRSAAFAPAAPRVRESSCAASSMARARLDGDGRERRARGLRGGGAADRAERVRDGRRRLLAHLRARVHAEVADGGERLRAVRPLLEDDRVRGGVPERGHEEADAVHDAAEGVRGLLRRLADRHEDLHRRGHAGQDGRRGGVLEGGAEDGEHRARLFGRGRGVRTLERGHRRREHGGR